MNLATVQKILTISPIEGADAIETAGLLGWEIVVKKNEFKVGDLCVYIGIDTIVPELPQYEFLRARHFRVRTIKLRKQISQGLIIPMIAGNYKEGDDVTEIMGVKKYSKDVEIPQDVPKMPTIWYKKMFYILKYKYLVKIFPSLKTFNRKSFPKDLVPITDEERIQNIPSVLEKHHGRMYVVSEKLDGSSITIIHERSRFGKTKFRICSRRFELFDKNNAWYKVFLQTNFSFQILKLVDYYQTTNIIVQGEFIGKPQGNKYQLKADEIRLFNIYVDGVRLLQNEFYQACESLVIPCCPNLGTIPLNFSLKEIIAFAEGKSMLNNQTEREGLVFRCTETGHSFKAISNKFMLKNDE